MSKQYYVGLKDGYEIGDTYIHDGDDTQKYIIVDILLIFNLPNKINFVIGFLYEH